MSPLDRPEGEDRKAQPHATPHHASGTEEALTIDCHGVPMVGILHQPAGTPRQRGVVMVVGGGPQYRVGGHRQLTLWARALCRQGYPVLRFDYRGMGDTAGRFEGFLQVDDDIRAAVDRLAAAQPALREVVLWGECDASTAIMLYAGRDPRVHGAVLLNPWVRTEALQAKATLKHYYLQRLLQPSFWRKVASGRFNPARAAGEVVKLVRAAGGASGSGRRSGAASGDAGPIPRNQPLPEMMLQGVQRFRGRLMLVMGGRDLIAREFDALLAASPAWRDALHARQLQRHDLPEGDHTFSSASQRNQVAAWGLDWLGSW